ncbi:clumping factor A-like [Pollicipes pollicipes]|uniref:clumping factor A-like n=1 Tax=Pollicipes pollicipes TaxID=41117 RepID=UPI0018852758|nr:clumping factor A-like [Pollicipes pollicipes]
MKFSPQYISTFRDEEHADAGDSGGHEGDVVGDDAALQDAGAEAADNGSEAPASDQGSDISSDEGSYGGPDQGSDISSDGDSTSGTDGGHDDTSDDGSAAAAVHGQDGVANDEAGGDGGEPEGGEAVGASDQVYHDGRAAPQYGERMRPIPRGFDVYQENTDNLAGQQQPAAPAVEEAADDSQNMEDMIVSEEASSSASPPASNTEEDGSGADGSAPVDTSPPVVTPSPYYLPVFRFPHPVPAFGIRKTFYREKNEGYRTVETHKAHQSTRTATNTDTGESVRLERVREPVWAVVRGGGRLVPAYVTRSYVARPGVVAATAYGDAVATEERR